MKLDSHEQINRLLNDGLNQGQSIAEFTQSLMDSGVRDEYHRARSASLTEVLRAHSVARQEALVQSPAVEYKEWVHTGGYRNAPRILHAMMNGVMVPKDKPFELLGADGIVYQPQYPRDSVLPAGECVNCHCLHRGIVSADVLGLPLVERQRLQVEAVQYADAEYAINK